MQIIKTVGITSFGYSLPQYKILTTEIERAQGKAGQKIGQALGVISKSVPSLDEDTITLATQAAAMAISARPQLKQDIGALFIGSESHPYAVKPSGTVVKSVLGLSENLALADLQFACKAATQGLQIGLAYILSDLAKQTLIIGADTAQSQPGDALEYTAGAGAAAYMLGSELVLAKVLATSSIATDTPDFWRRPGESYPQHAGRFSGEPAYFYHITTNAQQILNETGLGPQDIKYCIFHTPNGKFPKQAALQLGFKDTQLAPSMLVSEIGNTYAAAVPLALAAVLEQAQADEKILVVSYGSGSGSDAFILETTDLLPIFNRERKSDIRKKIEEMSTVDYITYQASMNALTH